MSEYEFEEQNRTSFGAVEGLLLEDGADWVGVRISNEKVPCAVSFTHPKLPGRQITRVGVTFYAAFIAAKAALHDALEEKLSADLTI